MAQKPQDNFEKSYQAVTESLKPEGGSTPEALEQQVQELLEHYDILKKNAVEAKIIQMARGKIESLLKHEGWEGNEALQSQLKEVTEKDVPLTAEEQQEVDKLFRGVLSNPAVYKTDIDSIKEAPLKAAALIASRLKKDSKKWSALEESITLLEGNTYIRDIRKELDKKEEISDTNLPERISIRNPRSKSEADAMVRKIENALSILQGLAKTTEREKASLETLMGKATVAPGAMGTAPIEAEISKIQGVMTDNGAIIKNKEEALAKKKEARDQMANTIQEMIKANPDDLIIDLKKSEQERLEQEMSALEAEVKQAQQKQQELQIQLSSLETKRSETVAAAQSAANLEKERESQRKQKEDTLKSLETKIRELEKSKKDLQEVMPHIRTEKMTPQQLLAQILAIGQGENVALDQIENEMEETLRRHEKAQEKQLSGFEKAMSITAPTLPKTLEKIFEAKEIKGMSEEEKQKTMETLLKHYKNEEGLKEWMEEMGEGAKKKIPTLVAYLTYAVTQKKLNALSQEKAETLLETLRKARNKLVIDKIKNNPEFENKNEQVKTEAYLKELKTWEKGVASINKKIIEELVTESQIKKLSLGVGGIGALSLLSWGAVTSIGSLVGLKNFGIAGGYAAGRFGGTAVLKKLGYKVDEEKFKKYYNPTAQAVIGAMVFGWVGLGVPAAVMAAKWRYKNKENLGKDKELSKKAIKGAWNAAASVGRGIKSVFTRKKAA